MTVNLELMLCAERLEVGRWYTTREALETMGYRWVQAKASRLREIATATGMLEERQSDMGEANGAPLMWRRTR